MTAYTRGVVHCDGGAAAPEDCPAKVIHGKTRTEARQEAIQRGWTVNVAWRSTELASRWDMSYDYCPEHTPGGGA